MQEQNAIKAIDSSSVHKITSGQVVVDLQTAVKELVENSLDAGANNIEVRFKDSGLTSIEVIDNGSGISSEDYDGIALKHYTSKLDSFDDLTTVRTFGFRGEALSSLCALSQEVSVITASVKDAPMGTVLKFDRNGCVQSRDGRSARQRGTTVIIAGLFAPLPVRRRELERNIKREFAKSLTLLQAYALVPCARENKGVRLTVTNHQDGGKRTVQLRTDGVASLKSCVSSLWGPKALDGVVPLELLFGVEAEKSVIRRQVASDSQTSIRVRGLISKFALGSGRTSNDRQFFYVNGRPCNLPKLQKAFNEIYRTYNVNQYPFLIADFQVPTDTYDINVSPDKRTIFVHGENNIIEGLKRALDSKFSPVRSVFPVNDEAAPTPESRRPTDVPSDHPLTSYQLQSQDTQRTLISDGSVANLPDRIPPKGMATFLSSPLSTTDLQSDDAALTLPPPLEHRPLARLRSVSVDPPSKRKSHGSDDTQALVSFPPDAASGRTIDADVTISTGRASWNPSPAQNDDEVSRKKARLSDDERPNGISRHTLRTQLSVFARAGSQISLPPVEDEDGDTAMLDVSQEDSILRHHHNRTAAHDVDALDHLDDPIPVEVSTSPTSLRTAAASKSRSSKKAAIVLSKSDEETFSATARPKTFVTRSKDGAGRPLTPPPSDSQPPRTEILRTVEGPDITMRIDASELADTWLERTEPKWTSGQYTTVSTVLPAAGLTNTTDTEGAESELARIIHKEDFQDMTIIGQFNLGFILARRRLVSRSDNNPVDTDDLFIIDQHAADEKYNYETLQCSTKIQSQKLFRPRPLEITAADEVVAIENMKVLSDNGFEVLVDEEALPGKGERVKLAAQPLSKETVFDTKDLEELLHLLKDQPAGTMVRCSKARSMFAMRACRKSVMVGKALKKAQMISIVRHMGMIEQPWNCPHGRPTMRHLATLADFTSRNSRSSMLSHSLQGTDWYQFANVD